MEEEDKEFFILVLGVLAAILMVISWWYTTGGTAVSTTRVVAEPGVASQADDTSEGAAETPAGDADGSNAAPADTSATDTTGATDATNATDSSDESADTTQDDPAPPTESDDGADGSASADAPVAATVFDAIASDEKLSVITGLLRDTGLDDVLARGGPFTVFAPSNDAINEAAGSDTTVAVLETAREAVLSYHVVPGEYTIAALTEIARGARSTELTTVQGEPITLTLEGETIVINGTAVILAGAQATGNGIVHTLDNVLVPPIAALNALVGTDPILFAPGSATIEAASLPTLDRFIDVLSNSDTNVTIEGHTDSSGDPILNQNLSQARARSVLNYLVANGVEESRLSAQGFGPSRPVGDNNTEAGRALNRRIEFTQS